MAAKILKGASRQYWKDDGDDQEDDQEKDDFRMAELFLMMMINMIRMPRMGLRCRCN